jgi:hypothetical protein
MIVAIISLLVGFAAGFYAGVKNASSSKVAKGLDILKALKGK